MFQLLEAECARLHNLPDEEFTDAYLGFRKRVEEAIAKWAGDGVIGTSLSFLFSQASRLWTFFTGEGIVLIDRTPGW